jgi:hypothetical protein
MLLKGFEENGRGAAPPLSRALAPFRRYRRRRRLFSLAHVSPKHRPHATEVDYLSGDPDTLSEAEENLPEHAKDGLRMFRTAARALAPGRTVAAQIRAVAKALYGHRWLSRWGRTKRCCYREAGPATVLDFKYRFEAWRQGFVSRQEAKAERALEALQERRKLREARSDQDTTQTTTGRTRR